MKKLKILFVAFFVVMLTTVTAVASTGSQGADLVDFFNFDLDRAWSYASYFSAADVPGSTWNVPVTSGKCYEDASCVKHYYPNFSAKFRLNESGDVVAYKVGSEYIDEVVVLSNDPVSQIVPEAAFSLFGIDWVDAVNAVSAVNMTCDTELIADVRSDGEYFDVITQECVFTFTDQWDEQTVNVSRYYFDGVGLMQSTVVYSSDDNEIVPVELDEQSFRGTFNFAGEYNWNPSEVNEFFYNDVADSHKNFEAIVYMFEKGIMSGYEDGDFRASKRINRAELLKVLVEATGSMPALSEYNGCFVDVVGEWYEAYACYAKDLGWIDGYSNGKFQGSDPVNKVEALKMILNAFEVELIESTEVKPFADITLDAWYAPYVATSKDMGLLEMDKFYIFDKRAEMRRGEVAEILYRLMTK